MPRLPLHAVVQGLTNTPPEVAHQILDDLRVYDILRLACHNKPTINHAIMSHPICAKAFHDDFALLSSVTDVFRFYWDLCRYMQLKVAPSDSVLALAVSSLPTRTEWRVIGTWECRVDHPATDYKKIAHYIDTRLAQFLSLTRWQQEILARYAAHPEKLSPVWDNSLLANVKERWEEMLAAQATLNAARVDQLTRAARLLEFNSDMLKRSTDPGQKRRPNLQHQLARLQADGAKMARALLIRGQNVGASHFRYVFFPVCPFDAALEFVVEMLEKHGLSETASSDEKANHPPSILSRVDTLLTGMPFVYGYPVENPEESHSKTKQEVSALRTLHTPYSADAGAEPEAAQKPRFVHGRAVRRQPDVPWCKQSKAWVPHDPRELEWLEAFVEVYRYLEGLNQK